MSAEMFSPEVKKVMKDRFRAYQVAARRARLAYLEEKERKAKENES